MARNHGRARYSSAKKWCFTRNFDNSTEINGWRPAQHPEDLPQLGDHEEYVVWQHERGEEEGHDHLQVRVVGFDPPMLCVLRCDLT